VPAEDTTTNEIPEPISLEYSLFPANGIGIATIIEWENGDGFDISLNGRQISLTDCDAQVVVELLASWERQNALDMQRHFSPKDI